MHALVSEEGAVRSSTDRGYVLFQVYYSACRQLDRVSRQSWAAGAGPGDSPLTIDLSTICQTYGLDKEGARDHNYTGARG